METAEVLKKISYICRHSKKCKECPLWEPRCTMVAAYWNKTDIKKMTEVIENYKEEEK